MTDKLKRFINSIESLKIGLGWWLVTFFAIIAIRNFLEGALEKVKVIGCAEDPFEAIIVFFGHYPLLYVSQFMILVIILRLLTREHIEKISKTVIVFWIIWFPPLFDYIWSGGLGENLNFAHTLSELRIFFIHCANPAVGFPETVSPGIRIEFMAASLLSFAYIMLKTGRLLKALAGALLFYSSLIFYVFGFPALVAYGWNAIFPNLPPNHHGAQPFEQIFYAPSLLASAAKAITLLYLDGHHHRAIHLVSLLQPGTLAGPD